MATRSRKLRSCKNGKLKRVFRTKKGSKRRYKKSKKRKTKKRKSKRSRRKYRMKSLKEMSRDAIRRSEMLQNIPGGYERRREVIRKLPNEQSMLLEKLMPAQLSDISDEILLKIFENNSLDELSNLYKTNRRLRRIAVDIVERRYTQEEKDEKLIEAIEKGNTDAVILLIKVGADPNMMDEYGGYTALMVASGEGYPEIVRILLDAGVNPNEYTISQNTALLISVQNGNTEIVRMLLNAGADPNMMDEDQFAPISSAIENNEIEMVRMLLDAGVDTSIFQEIYSMTPVEFAESERSPEIADLLRQYGATE